MRKTILYIAMSLDGLTARAASSCARGCPHLLAGLRAQAGKDIWVCGSAALAQDCIRADCIDQYRITVIPILLGQGVRLFPSDGPCLPLRLLSAVSAGSMTELTYARR